ncbi:MAG TPA: L,D-transpeptidase family protein, partial [Ilumatobacter sp.]|nr:L,D-transpeptidase family protein [Ilumatobacter sp.]
MRVPVPSVIGIAAMFVLPACATTTLASTPTPPTVATTTTVPDTTTSTSTTTTSTTTTSTTTTTTIPVTTTTTTIPPVSVIDPPLVGVGTSDGDETRRAQMRLLELGFWLQDADGDYGLTTRQAVMAFQKYHGLTTDGVLGDDTAAVLTNVTERPKARADAGTLVEVDKGLQLLFFVIDGRVEWILNTSTGTEIPYREPNKNKPGEWDEGDSVTRNGLHAVYRERAEGWWEGDLGEIYRPKYFSGGIAVHGSNHIPDYPASHGCVRVSVPAMDW